MGEIVRAPEKTVGDLLLAALAAARKGEAELRGSLHELAAAIYVTNADGLITYFNPACIAFSGRAPSLGQDRWCVTWKLYTEAGEFLPHDECPMATAIETRRPIRGVSAIAERPDGTRVAFLPYPTPIFSDDGVFLGAVNILIDITDSRQACFLRAQARKCQRLAGSVGDQATADTLNLMAAEYEQRAGALDGTDLLLEMDA